MYLRLYMSLNVLFRMLWWLIPPLIIDKMTYILVMQFSIATDGAVHTGLTLMFKMLFRLI